LHVPTVYFDAPWPNSRSRVDLLVIDRAGAGDVHAVEIVKDLEEGRRHLATLMKLPAQFRWISYIVDPSDLNQDLAEYGRVHRTPLFAPKGMGRVGVILVRVDEDRHGEHLSAEIAARAERFPGSYYEDADRFAKTHKPDILFR
jgi:hypothetical protein